MIETGWLETGVEDEEHHDLAPVDDVHLIGWNG